MKKNLSLIFLTLLLTSLVIGSYSQYSPSIKPSIRRQEYEAPNYKAGAAKYGYKSILDKYNFRSFFDRYFGQESCTKKGYCGDAKPFDNSKQFVKFLDKFEQKQFEKFRPLPLPAISPAQNGPVAIASPVLDSPAAPALAPAPAPASGNQASTGPNFSETNNQVENVDEADLIKTDGNFIYTISNGVVSIIKAFPAEKAEVVWSIEHENEYPQQLFIEGNLMAYFGTRYEERSYTFVRVYDVSDRTHPVLLKTYDFEGYFIRGRKTEGVIYLVSNFGSFNREKELPVFRVNGQQMRVSPSKIFTYPQEYNYPTFTNIFALKLEKSQKGLSQPNIITLIIENSHQIFVSASNIYITNVDYSLQNQQRTIIHKVKFDGINLIPYADGSVPGYIINQFSMDEFKDFFRIATTNGFGDQSSSGVYCLDQKLKLVGSVDKIAPTESIFSTRFIGDILYMVTFRQVDPFFTIDLSDHTKPRIIGQLKIPGFSRYLHPFDQTTIIGLGNDATPEGRVLGLKVSLFDVSDLKNPKESASFVVPQKYSSSTALFESRAFLFSREKELLAIPGYFYEPESGQNFNGAFVFKITKSQISLRGIIDHSKKEDPNGFFNSFVERSLFIEDNLYTKSSCLLKINAIENLIEVKDVSIPCRQQNFIIDPVPIDPVPIDPQPEVILVVDPVPAVQGNAVPLDSQQALDSPPIRKPIAISQPAQNVIQIKSESSIQLPLPNPSQNVIAVNYEQKEANELADKISHLSSTKVWSNQIY